MRVIFLDFDGVVVCLPKERGQTAGGRWTRRANIEAVEQLNDLVARTGAEIVVSSVWRLHPGPVDYLTGTLARSGFRGAVLDVTPDLVPHGDRGFEVADWLKRHPETTSYVVLDDDYDLGPIPPRRWVLVKDGFFNGGLQAEHVERAIAVLEEPL